MTRALVADDSRTARLLLAQALRTMGYEVHEAANGQEALAMIQVKNEPIELVLADWNMPEMSGLELLKRVRASSSLPVVMVSRETDIDRIAEALAAGANEYIMKPFTPEIVVDKLRIAGIKPEERPCTP